MRVTEKPGPPSALSPSQTSCLHSSRGTVRSQSSGAGLPWGAMDSLMELGVLWSLLLQQDSRSPRGSLRRFVDVPAGAEHCCQHGSEEIPAVSV